MKKSLFYLSILAICNLYSCKKDETTIQPSSDKSVLNSGRVSEKKSYDGEFELGERLENPYSLKNMEAALKELKKISKDFDDIAVVNNFNYVRIEAKTEKALWNLEGKEDIDIFNYPMDYKVVKSGNKFIESGKKTQFQVYWAAVPIDFEFEKDVEVTVIEKLFLPFGNGKKAINMSSNLENKYKFLENKSLTITGNVSPDIKSSRITGNTPYGTIKVWDETLMTFLPIEGVTVRAKRWFTTRTQVTLPSGIYSMTYDFNGPVDYDIIWEQNDFDIRTGSYGQALTSQNNVNGSWSPNIVANSPQIGFFSQDSFRWAHAFRAAYLYYYKISPWGIKTPPKKGSILLGLGKMKIGVRAGTTAFQNHFFDFNGAVLSAQVMIEVDQNDLNKMNGRWIFSTTIHELGHASHWELGFTDSDWLNQTKKKLTESWSVGLEWKITNDVYRSLSPTSYLDWSLPNYQLYQLSSIPSLKYTPLFIDLMDFENQSLKPGYQNAGLPNDQVGGFTLATIENRLAVNVNNWDGLRDALKIYQPLGVINGSSANIEYLFNNYK